MSEYIFETFPAQIPCEPCNAKVGDVWVIGGKREQLVRCRDCKHGHITIDGKNCKWCDRIATHNPDGCEPNNGYDPEPYFSADFFCAWGERKGAE